MKKRDYSENLNFNKLHLIIEKSYPYSICQLSQNKTITEFLPAYRPCQLFK